MSSTNQINRNLQELSGSNYEIADGQPDIRGWDVKDESGRKIGKVKELLFDEASRKVRYIVQDLKGNDFDLKSRRVLLPIGIARLHESGDDIILEGVSAQQLESLPEYDKDNLTPDMEHSIRNTYAGSALAGTALASNPDVSDRESFYDHDHFNEDNLYRNRTSGDNAPDAIPVIREDLQVGKREVVTGGIRLRSRIVETPVQEDITLREERVQVARVPVDRAADASDLKEDFVELTERSEVPVVSKDARVVEEITVSKEVTEQEEVIRDTVRDTEVDIDRVEKGNKKKTGKRGR
jgi:stress response protein YsnF